MGRRKLILKITFNVVLLAIALSCLSCGHADSKKRIAFVLKTLSNPYFIDMEAGARKAASQHQGIELVVKAADRESDVERQIQIVEDLVGQGVSAICITPSDSKAIVPTILKANKRGIPVVVLDTKLDSATVQQVGAIYASFIGSDNYLGGKMAGEYIANRINGNGKVAILEGVPGQETAISRKSGFIDVIAKYSGIKVVASQPADWNREKGLNVFQNILEANPGLTAVFACNDEMALGAIRAIELSKKIRGHIVVVGFDATKDALESIRGAKLDATIAQLPEQMGMKGFETAAELIQGKSVSGRFETEVKLVTNENVGK